MRGKHKGYRDQYFNALVTLLIFFYEKMMLCPEGYQLMGSCFCHGSVFICLLLPENMIICDKCLSKCGKPAK